jgi:uncharacterized protein
MAVLLEIPPAAPDARADATRVRMRDGVELATDVYLPEPAGQRRPAVLIRLPYDKSGRYTFMPGIGGYLAAHGFAAVIQDVRGKFRSAGERFPFVHEAADGADTLDWIVAQSWSDGTVGMMGDSYYGYTQWAAASTGHPALRALVPRVTGSRFLEWFSPEYVPKIPMFEWVTHIWAAAHSYESPVMGRDPQQGLELVPDELGHVRELVSRLIAQAGSGELLARSYPAGQPAGRVRLPALQVSGWFDNVQKAQIDDWHRTRELPDQFLRMGANDHEDFRYGAFENHEIDDAALVRYLPRLLDEPVRFFDHYLSGRPGRWLAPRVRYEVVHGGWEVADRWPLVGPEPTRWFLGDGGTLGPAPGAGERYVEWVHDPANPVPFLVESEWGMLAGLPDESVLHSRPDVTAFTSEPAGAPWDVLGPVDLDVEVSADTAATYVIARLHDVDPGGRATFVLEGAAVARRGERTRVRLGDTAYRVRRGHRLRLAVSTSSFPQYLVHPGTDEDPWHATTRRTARQRLRTGGPDGAALHLHIRALETDT